MKRLIAPLAVLALLPLHCGRAGENLLVNPGFEAGAAVPPEGWSAFWSRAQGAGSIALDEQVKHGGARALKITHTGEKDWSVAQRTPLAVSAGDIFLIGAWIKCDSTASMEVSVTTRRADGEVLGWIVGAQRTGGTHDWQAVAGKLVVPPACATLQFRVTGNGKCTAWVDDVTLVKEGNVSAFTGPLAGKTLTVSNALLDVRLKAEDGTLSVTDKRGGRVWEQKPFNEGLVVKAAAMQGEAAMKVDLMDVPNGADRQVTLALVADKPELGVTVDGAGPLQQPIGFPHPFVTAKGTWLIVPMNEGISYPVDDESISPLWLVTYGGHGICMPWFGAVDPQSGAGVMALFETPDDAHIEITRQPGTGLFIRPVWEASRGQLAYARKITYAFFDKGGYVAQAKRYREHAKKTGLFKTLAQKKAENPNVDLLIGAANIWNWDMGKVDLCKEMKAAGMDYILWSGGGKAAELEEINKLGYLSSRYDIYQDVMDPAKFKDLRWTHGDWTTEGWPKDLMLGPNGDWIRGWEVETKDGKMYPCGTLCDRQAPAYADKRIGEELKTKPYRCRFIDTTTASPWRECYDPNHPLTRGESRHWKMELLRLVSEKYKLVTGCETGHDASVPFLHYFEGMLSLGPYRVHDAGRDMLRIVDPPEPQVVKFQLGHTYRVPLWELVYHDCTVAQWYWGDYNNKLPALWDKRDLFNILYGTPPMYMFNKRTWGKDKERFVQSYKSICPLVRKIGYDEMLSHEFLTPDRAVQRTRWSSGVEVTVNFGDKPFTLPDGKEVKAMGWAVAERK
ncbi:MAG: carbohydrate binding domain-containing protein [Planctomycetota bacterium]|nr:carbohydrate binding domain-containing protein [Planctomycetota bacterium]